MGICQRDNPIKEQITAEGNQWVFNAVRKSHTRRLLNKFLFKDSIKIPPLPLPSMLPNRAIPRKTNHSLQTNKLYFKTLDSLKHITLHKTIILCVIFLLMYI